ncbi:hypothetical protein Spb1_36100 [Planctopirus ephydatiae]|uniref:Uncharacterized protein n=1 Tax=Planctopirus ephydatiae TaxID=2528019 RepID=A0A518GSV7_9PLAN|nr:hypothetical protein [Planctopirus ephydatiae]QDV31665.1 hypothetical protein Spb1_36100 [Planctopirus ephydatiae]
MPKTSIFDDLVPYLNKKYDTTLYFRRGGTLCKGDYVKIVSKNGNHQWTGRVKKAGDKAYLLKLVLEYKRIQIADIAAQNVNVPLEEDEGTPVTITITDDDNQPVYPPEDIEVPVEPDAPLT